MMPCFRQLVPVSSSLLLLIVVSAALSGCLQEAPTPSVERGVAMLVALLQDQSPEVRRTAAESLGKIGDPTTLPAVVPLLHDPVPAVRATAAQALGRMASPADEAVIMGLSRALEDPDDKVRQAAALALGDIEPSPRQLSTVADLLRGSDVHVRRAAVHALLALDTSQIASWLLPALDDPDAEVRQGAVAALGLSGDRRAETALLKRLFQDPAPAVRAEAAYHLGELGGLDTATVLRTAVEKEPDRGVRRWMEAELKALRVND
ncbi:MAG TPA: HEAT repeat domain-containing protein [Nitrospira sp.]|nr:HEAT repeat domain-containing protein [Nitrospira sp.]